MFHWLRYQIRKLLRPRVITNDGVRIDLGPVAGTRYARALYRDDHERDERDIVRRQLADCDTVLELGAGLGLVTIECCRRIGSERVHAFEANPELEPVLRRNFALNGVAPQLQLRLVSLQPGRQEFYIADRFVQSSRAALNSARRIELDSLPLPQVLAETRPTFLILDIEGGELDLADPSVDLTGVRKLCVEMHPHLIGDDGVSRVTAALLHRGFNLRLSACRGCVLYFERPAAATISHAA